jgi:hypothetical protein
MCSTLSFSSVLPPHSPLVALASMGLCCCCCCVLFLLLCVADVCCLFYLTV